MSTDLKSLMGIRLKNLRKNLHFTQEEVANQLGVSLKHYSEVERGLAGLSYDNLIRLCEILETSTDYVLTGKFSTNVVSPLQKLADEIPKDKQVFFEQAINSILKILE